MNNFQKWNLEMHEEIKKNKGDRYWEKYPIQIFHNAFKCTAVGHKGGDSSRDINSSVANYYLASGSPVINIRCWECQQQRKQKR